MQFDVPINKLVCRNCSSKLYIPRTSVGSASYTTFTFEQDDVDPISIPCDVKNIKFKKIESGVFQAYTELYIDCAICNCMELSTAMFSNAGFLFKNIKKECECGSKLNANDETVEMNDIEGKWKVNIKILYSCKDCTRNYEIKHTEMLDNPLTNHIYDVQKDKILSVGDLSNRDIKIHIEEITYMENQTNNNININDSQSGIVSVGNSGTISGNSLTQSNTVNGNIDYNSISEELTTLIRDLYNENKTGGEYIARLEEAVQAAQEKNKNKLIEILKEMPLRVFELCKNVGAGILANFISGNI